MRQEAHGFVKRALDPPFPETQGPKKITSRSSVRVFNSVPGQKSITPPCSQAEQLATNRPSKPGDQTKCSPACRGRGALGRRGRSRGKPSPWAPAGQTAPGRAPAGAKERCEVQNCEINFCMHFRSVAVRRSACEPAASAHTAHSRAQAPARSAPALLVTCLSHAHLPAPHA